MTDTRVEKYQQFVMALNELYRPLMPASELAEAKDGMLGEALLQLYRTIRLRYQISDLIRQATERINEGRKFPEIFDFLFESLRAVIRCDRMGIGLLEAGNERLKLQWVRSINPILQLKIGYSAPMFGSSLQKILETNQPRILGDLVAYLKEHPDSKSTELACKEGLRSSLTCPLISGGKPVGFIFFSSTDPYIYNTGHTQLLLGIAAELSLLVEQARLWRFFTS